MEAAVDWPDAALVARTALEFFVALSKNGKPQPNEFTVYAAFLISSEQDCSLRVVAAGSGTKCLPGSKRSPRGNLVSDCHAEVVAHRALVAWLYGEAELAVQQYTHAVATAGKMGSESAGAVGTSQPATAATPHGEPSFARLGEPDHKRQKQQHDKGGQGNASGGASGGPSGGASGGVSALELQAATGQLALRPGIRLHMYVSQPPCGDASIIQAGSAAASGCQLPVETASDLAVVRGAEAAAAGRQAAGELVLPMLLGGEDERACCAAAGVSAVGGVREDEGQVVRLRTGAKALKLVQQQQGQQQQGQQQQGQQQQRQHEEQRQEQQQHLQGEGTSQAAGPPPPPQQQQPASPGGMLRPPQGVQMEWEGTEQKAQGQVTQPLLPLLAPGGGGAGVVVVLPCASDVEAGAQELGVARRKPGKGEPTLSMSCSDKLAKWTCLGLQGCLLGALMAAPLRLHSLTVAVPPGLALASGQEVPQSALAAARRAAERAVSGRIGALLRRLPSPFRVGEDGDAQRLRVEAVGPPPVELGLAPTERRTVGSGASITWYAAPGCCFPHWPQQSLPAVGSPHRGYTVGPAAPDGSSSQSQQQPGPSNAAHMPLLPASLAGGAEAGRAPGSRAGGLGDEHGAQREAPRVAAPPPRPRPGSGTLEALSAGEGCRAGLPKSARASRKNWPGVCRAALLQRFCGLVEKLAACDIAGSAAERAPVEGPAGTVAPEGEMLGRRRPGLVEAREPELPRAPAPCREVLRRVAAAAAATPSAGAAATAAGGGVGQHAAASGMGVEQGSGSDVHGVASVGQGNLHEHLTALRSCPYGTVKDVCGEVGGSAAAWHLARQAPSPFEHWIPKPEALHAFTSLS